MTFNKIKKSLKTGIDDIFWRYGKSCSKHPLRYVLCSIFIVLACSLPFLNTATLKKIMTFVGRVEAQDYFSHVDDLIMPGGLKEDVPLAFVQQLIFNVSLKSSTDKLTKYTHSELLLGIIKSKPIEETLTAISNSDFLGDNCFHVSRTSTIGSWLAFSRSRFHSEMKKWFKGIGCLTISPSLVNNVSQRVFTDLPASFKEMMFGLPTKALHQPHVTEITIYEKHIKFVASVFLKTPKGFQRKLKELTQSSSNVFLTEKKGAAYKITYERFEDLGAIEFLPLILTYLIVFLYLLFSLAKVKTLRSRWGLAFSAIMTLILSLGMTVGICASMDLIPVTISITEIFPYVVIVLGIENVLKITHSVMMTGEQFPIPDRIAYGLRRESAMMVQNLCFMLVILSCGLVTNIPAIKEFSAFVAVGLVCNFFLQLVFYTPILYVDIKRAGLLPLHVSIQDSLRISFNLIPSPNHTQRVGDSTLPATPTLAPPTPLPSAAPPPSDKAEFSFFYWWERLRIVQRLFMVGFVIYLSYSVYFTFYVPNSDVPSSQRSSPLQPIGPVQNHQQHQPSHLKCLSDYEARTESFDFPWQFSCSQIFPEILTFYQMHLHERSLVVLPLSVLHFNLGLDDLILPIHDRDTFWQANSSFLVACMAVLIFVVPCLYALVLVRTAHQPCVIEPEVDAFIWKGHEYQVEWIVTDGVYIASLCLGGYIRIWDSLTDNCKAVIDRRASSALSLPESEQDIPRLRLSSSTKDLLRDRGAAQVWCMDAFSGLLGLGCANGTVEIYSLSRECLIARQDAPSLGVICLTFLSRKTIAAAHLDGSIDFISINWHKKQRSSGSLPGERYADTLYEGDDRSNQQCQYTNVAAFREAIHGMVTVAGRVIAVGDNRIIKVFEGRDAVCLKSIRLRSGDINVISIKEPSNPVILCGTTEGVIHKFDVIQGQFCGDITGLSGAVISIKTNHLYTCALSSLNIVMVWANGSQEVILSRTFVNPVIDIAVLGANVLTIIMETHMELIPIANTSSYKIQRHSSLGSCMPLLPNQICCVDQSSLVIARGAEIEHFKFPNFVNKVE